ncbi:hypothetical protein HYW94_02090 [Candidatus Uhrbacteria bacterium]|nr:hypothetical protein [Candidatus Uhrbacteria bacterium]
MDSENTKRSYMKYELNSDRARVDIIKGYQTGIINDEIIDTAVSCLKDGMTELEVVKELRSIYPDTPSDDPVYKLTMIQAKEIVNAAIEKIEKS